MSNDSSGITVKADTVVVVVPNRIILNRYGSIPPTNALMKLMLPVSGQIQLFFRSPSRSSNSPGRISFYLRIYAPSVAGIIGCLRGMVALEPLYGLHTLHGVYPRPIASFFLIGIILLRRYRQLAR